MHDEWYLIWFPYCFLCLQAFQYSVIIHLIVVLYSATIVLFVLHNQTEKVTYFIFSVRFGVMFYFLC